MHIGPEIPHLNTLNFSSIVTSSANLTNPHYTLTSEGLLTITYDYNSTL